MGDRRDGWRRAAIVEAIVIVVTFLLSLFGLSQGNIQIQLGQAALTQQALSDIQGQQIDATSVAQRNALYGVSQQQLEQQQEENQLLGELVTRGAAAETRPVPDLTGTVLAGQLAQLEMTRLAADATATQLASEIIAAVTPSLEQGVLTALRDVAVRSGPSPQCQRTGELFAGDRVLVIERTVTPVWWRIDCDGICWVSELDNLGQQMVAVPNPGDVPSIPKSDLTCD